MPGRWNSKCKGRDTRDTFTGPKHRARVVPEWDAGGADGAETQRAWDAVLRGKGKSAK